jgi:uncharacterized membrane protein YeiH
MPLFDVVGRVEYPLEWAGVFAFALTGALLAVGKDFDVFGTIAMAELAGLGGGLLRDLVLGVRPVAFTDSGYYTAAAVAGLIVFFCAGPRRYERLCDVLDAAALGLASTTGTIKCLAHGLGPAPAVALGICTAAGGGCLSNILAREIPPTFRWDHDLYMLPAFVGAGSVAGLYALRELSVATAVGASVTAFGLRLLSMHYRWRTPRSRAWRRMSGARHPSAERRLPEAEESVTLRLPVPVPHYGRPGHPHPTPVAGGHVPRPEGEPAVPPRAGRHRR